MGLATSGLAAETGGWRRLVIEKPFGRDLRSAQELNENLLRVFREDQVYRIDHYLGKETVQNLLVFRFGNAIFEPVWNRNYVDNVQITVAESVDLAGRAGYYDDTGATRDMLQNHLLQLVALVAMEPPPTSDPETLRNMRVESLKAIRRWSPGWRAAARRARTLPGLRRRARRRPRLPHRHLRRGAPLHRQLALGGSTVLRPHRQGPGAQGVRDRRPIQASAPAHLRRRRRAAQRPLLLPPARRGRTAPLLRQGPDQGMSARPVDMAFHYGSAFPGEPIPDAYERLLQDAIEGDPSLFIRSDQIEESWRIVGAAAGGSLAPPPCGRTNAAPGAPTPPTPCSRSATTHGCASAATVTALTDIHLFPDAEELARGAAAFVAAAAEQSIRKRGRFVIALSGGSTPRRLYELLAERRRGLAQLARLLERRTKRPARSRR